MVDEKKNDQKIEETNLKIKALEIELENLDREVVKFLAELKVTPEQLTKFLEERENFTDENWVETSRLRKALDDKLKRELANIRNPKKIKRSLASLHVQRNWLHVK